MTGQLERSAQALKILSSAFASSNSGHFQTDVLAGLETLFSCQAVTMQHVTADGKNINPETLIIRGVSDSAAIDFKCKYFRNAPLARWILSRPHKAIPLSLRKEDALPDEGLSSENYRLFLRPNNLRHSLVLNLKSQGRLIGMIGLHRSVDAGRFTVNDRDFAALLANPLAGALERVDASRPRSVYDLLNAGNSAERPLTAREADVALEVSRGLRNREIAVRLGITENTVEAHLKTVFRKLGVRSRIDLATRLLNWAMNKSVR